MTMSPRSFPRRDISRCWRPAIARGGSNREIRRRRDVDLRGIAAGDALGPCPLGTTIWTGRELQAEKCDGRIGLALLYTSREWSAFAPGHHGYPRASDLILRKALRGR